MNSLLVVPNRRRTLQLVATRSLIVIALVLVAASQAMADGRRDHSFGYSYGRNESAHDWKLGDHYRIYRFTGRGWQRVEGSATDVGDGWVIGTDRRDGGYGIYRWNGYRFTRMPGAGVRIGGSYEHPWVINDRGERYEWNGRDWRRLREFGYDRHDRAERHGSSRRRSDW